MKQQEILQLSLHGYVLGSHFCRHVFQKGGACIFIREDLLFSKIDISDFCLEQDIEICGIQIGYEISNLIILCVYRAPMGDYKKFTTNLDSLLKRLYKPHTEFVICGDINIDYLSESSRKRKLNSLLETYNLSHTVSFPTRTQAGSSTAIDNIFIDKSRLNSYSTVPLVNGLSDHDAQILSVFNMSEKFQSVNLKIKKRIINAESLHHLNTCLQNESWENVYSTDTIDINTKFNAFFTTFTNYFNECFPVKVVKKCKSKNMWITQGIKISCARKRNLYLMSRNSDDPHVLNYYKNYCKTLTKVIKDAKKMYLNEKIQNSDNKIKTIWDIIKNETNRYSKSENITCIKINDSKIDNPKSIANHFNDFYINIIQNLNIQDCAEDAALGYLTDAFNTEFLGLKFIPTTAAEIMHVIKQLKTKYSSGYDEIPSKVLKACSEILSPPLSYLCNLSMQCGIFPERLKYSIVKPIYKKGDKCTIANYRPISLLTTFSKVFEKVMYNRLYHYLESNNILVLEQFGFRKQKSTENAAFSLVDEILNSLNSKLHVGGIFCDLAKAFDCVDHSILVKKLKFYGIKDEMLGWFTSYLSNRKQKVEINVPNSHKVTYSEFRNIKHGVPQGSILGPLLFLVYINDLALTINNSSHVILFADDTSVIISSKQYDHFINTSNTVLNLMNEWFHANKLALNVDKTSAVKFSTHNSAQVSYSIRLNGTHLKESISTKFLGLELDNHLNWKTHIECITRKLSSACYALRSLSTIGDINLLKMSYFAYFHSVMKYGLIFWGNSSEAKHVFVLQKKAIRIMAGVHKRTSCKNIFRNLEILTLPCEYILSLMMLYIKNQDKFSTNQDIHHFNTRHKSDLHLPSVSLSCFKKGVRYSCITVFNALPNYLKDLKNNEKRFRKELTKFLHTHTFYTIDELFMLVN